MKNNTSKLRSQRKLEHIRYSIELDDGPVTSSFEEIYLVHQSIPISNLDQISTKVSFLGKSINQPLIINALTGGVSETIKINKSLAEVAKETGIAMAVGSQSAALEDKKLAESFTVVRKTNPNGLIIANVSALIQWQSALRAVEMIGADALQIHFNVPQELIMKEGDRVFVHLLDNVSEIVSKAPVPVIAKEVGFGFSRETVFSLYGCGIRNIDIGGQGGTNFIAIEQMRRSPRDISHLQQWGIPTCISLLETISTGLPFTIIASGGIRSPLDVAKSLALGAQLVGVAAPFLRTLIKRSQKALVSEITNWQLELQKIILLAGASDILQLKTRPIVTTGKTKTWLDQRSFIPLGFSIR
jgi:isopentenyl-diphosphate delta-isomerase